MNKFQEERLAAAVAYAAKGWKVLPVGTNKRPINHNGSTGATTDIKQILAWWKESPFANIGIATGPESFWVVDVDMKDGINGLESLQKEYGDKLVFMSGEYLCATTATGGIHLLFQWPQIGVIKNAQGILPGVDIRGDGGYIVVAPSARKIDEKYVQYQWNNSSLPICRAPEWAQDLARRQEMKIAQGVDITKVMGGLTSGERDTELFRYACHLSSRGVPLELAKGFMSVAAERCVPPFSVDVALEKLETAYKYERPENMKDWRKSMTERVAKETNHGK